MSPKKSVWADSEFLKPEVAAAFKKQDELRKSKISRKLALMNILVLGLIFFDYELDFFFVTKIFANFRNDWRRILIFAEIFFAFLLIINIVNHVIVILAPFLGRSKFFLNEKQKRLLGIREKNSLPGFLSKPPPNSAPGALPAPSFPSQNKFAQGLAWLFRLRKRALKVNGSPVGALSPISPTQNWPISSDSSNYSPNVSMSPSWHQSSLTMNQSVGSYPTPSSSFASPDFKFNSFGAADELQNEVLRYRRAQSSTPNSSFKKQIKTVDELHDYLQRFHCGSASNLNQSLPAGATGAMTDGGYSVLDQSFASAAPIGAQLIDWPPPRIFPNVDLNYLANEKYQPAPLNLGAGAGGGGVPSVGSRTGKLDLSLGGASGGGAGAVTQSQLAPIFLSFDLDPNFVERLAQNLRTWISRTILIPLAGEILEFNQKCQTLGRSDLKLGETPLITFQKAFGSVKDPELMKFFGLIPYVNFNANQEYIVQRIQTLAKGSCLSEFNWDGGGEFKGKRWDEHLPTDSELIMHLLSAYLDGHLKSNPLYSDGKSFSDRFVVFSPEKPKNFGCQIFGVSLNPPIFQFCVDNRFYDLGRDRQHFFYVLLLFFQHFRKNFNNRLAEIDLGPAGLNISWIFQQI